MVSKMGSILLLVCVLISWCTLAKSGSIRTRRQINSLDSCLKAGGDQYTCCLVFGQNCNPSLDEGDEKDDKKKQKKEKQTELEDDKEKQKKEKQTETEDDKKKQKKEK